MSRPLDELVAHLRRVCVGCQYRVQCDPSVESKSKCDTRTALHNVYLVVAEREGGTA